MQDPGAQRPAVTGARSQSASEGDAPVVSGAGEDSGELREWLEAEDRDKWTPELTKAINGFARGREWGGKEWLNCVSLLVELERKTGFHDKGVLKAPSGKKERPIEVELFMGVGRHWENKFALRSEIGAREVEGSYAQRWWMWWEIGQPVARVENVEECWQAPEELDGAEWKEMGQRFGRNGMLLFVGGLFWWGEEAANDERANELLAEWHQAVVDVCRVLVEVVKTVGARYVNLAPSEVTVF